MDETQLTAGARKWLGIKESAWIAGQPDFDAAQLVVPAVAAWVNRLPLLRTVPGAEGAEEWAPDVVLGATMLAARLIRRRNSPAGVEAFTADGAAYVSRHDPDIARFLRLRVPQVG